MQRFFQILALTVGIASCSSETKVPDNVLDKSTMINLVSELHLTEAYVNVNYPYSDSARYIFRKLEDSVLKANGTQKTVFDSSMSYYQKDIKTMDEIYAASIDSLTLIEGTNK